MRIREAGENDLLPLLELYAHLHGDAAPPIGAALAGLWAGILADQNHHILLGMQEDHLVSSCVMLVVPNLSHGQRPYAVIENVVTHTAYRGRGYATSLLRFARDAAIRAGCYKIMLMTGSKREETLRFYENAGFNRYDKTAFIQWLSP